MEHSFREKYVSVIKGFCIRRKHTPERKEVKVTQVEAGTNVGKANIRCGPITADAEAAATFVAPQNHCRPGELGCSSTYILPRLPDSFLDLSSARSTPTGPRSRGTRQHWPS